MITYENAGTGSVALLKISEAESENEPVKRQSRKSFSRSKGKALATFESILSWFGLDEYNDHGSMEMTLSHQRTNSIALIVEKWVPIDKYSDSKFDSNVINAGGYQALTISMMCDARHLFTFHVSPRAIRFIVTGSNDVVSVEGMEISIRQILNMLTVK